VKGFVRQHIGEIVLVGGIVTFVLILLFLQLRRFNLLGALAFDLGIYEQAAWQMAQGQPLFNTVRGTHFFGDHFRPIMFLFVPFYRLWAHPFWGKPLHWGWGLCPFTD
jgi:uncharacterized membrane protein